MSGENTPSYLREMLASQGNLYAGLGALAAGALLSIPFGFGVGALPLIAFAAGEVIAALYIPSSPTFRARVDSRHRAANRHATRSRLLAEIESRAKRRSNYPQHLQLYSRLTERVAALYRHAESNPQRIAERDVERLDDATLEFLCMWLAWLVMKDRSAAIDLREIEQRIAGLDREAAAPAPGTDLRQLQKARADYAALVERHRRMASRMVALEAAMISMPDQIEEIYQTIMTGPATEGAGARLDESIARLRLQEDIEAELAGDLAEALPDMVSPLPRGDDRRRRLSAVGSRQAAG